MYIAPIVNHHKTTIYNYSFIHVMMQNSFFRASFNLQYHLAFLIDSLSLYNSHSVTVHSCCQGRG